MNKFNLKKQKTLLFVLFSLFLTVACNAYQDDNETIITHSVTSEKEPDNFLVLPQQNPYMLRTTFRANDLDLETPLRCNVNWKTQEMVQILPHNNVSFRLERIDINDDLTDFVGRHLKFDNIPAEQALL